MASAFLDVCRFTPTAGSTTDWTYSSAVTGYQSPTAAQAVNGTSYTVRSESTDLSQWEISTGAYNSATGVFARSNVLYNSAGTGSLQGGAGTNKISFSTVPQVAVIAAAEDLVNGASVIGLIEFWPVSNFVGSRLKCNGASYNRSSYVDLFNYLVKSGAATFTNGSANVGMTAHSRSVSDPIKLFTTGTLPTNFAVGTHGLVTSGTVYYVKTVVDANTVTLSATPGGTAISAGSAGSGIHAWVCAPHGDGDGSTTFTVPELRGEFPRFLDDGRGVDTNRAPGSAQLDAFQGHYHALSNGNLRAYTPDVNNGVQAPTGSAAVGAQGYAVLSPSADGTSGAPRTAAETRPRNIAVQPTIRYAA